MQKTERIHWAKQGLNLSNREEAISNRKMVKYPILPIYKEFESIDSIFIASVLIHDYYICYAVSSLPTASHE